MSPLPLLGIVASSTVVLCSLVVLARRHEWHVDTRLGDIRAIATPLKWVTIGMVALLVSVIAASAQPRPRLDAGETTYTITAAEMQETGDLTAALIAEVELLREGIALAKAARDAAVHEAEVAKAYADRLEEELREERGRYIDHLKDDAEPFVERKCYTGWVAFGGGVAGAFIAKKLD